MDAVRIVARPGNPGEDAVVSNGSLDSKLADTTTLERNPAAHQGGVRYKA